MHPNHEEAPPVSESGSGIANQVVMVMSWWTGGHGGWAATKAREIWEDEASREVRENDLFLRSNGPRVKSLDVIPELSTWINYRSS